MLEEDGPGLLALLARLTLRPDVAEDLMQDLFVNLSRSQGFLRSGNPSAYARRAAMHLAFNWRRNRKRHKEQDAGTDQLATGEITPLMRLMRAEQVQGVLDALAHLPEASRELVVMRFVEECSYEEIARHIGRTVHQTRALCHKGIERLRRSLQCDARGTQDAQEVRHV